MSKQQIPVGKVLAFCQGVLIVLGGSLTFFWVNSRSRLIGNFGWDVSVYTSKLSEFGLGLSPYEFNGHNNRLAVPSYFPYHPYIFRLFWLIDSLLSLHLFLIFVYLLIYIFFCFSLYSFYLKEDLSLSKLFSFSIKLTFYSLPLGGSALIGLFSGNIAFPLHALLISTIFSIAKKSSSRHLTMYSFCLVMSALCKPYFLLYLFPLFLIIGHKAATKISITISFVFFLIWISPLFMMRDDFLGYLKSIRYMTFGLGDFGFSVYSIFRSQLGDRNAIFLHVILNVAFLLFYYLFSITNDRMFRKNKEILVVLSIFFVVNANIRMKEYDFGILYPLIVGWLVMNCKAKYLSILAMCNGLLIVRFILLRISDEGYYYMSAPFLYLRYWEIALLWMAQLLLVLKTNRPKLIHKLL